MKVMEPKETAVVANVHVGRPHVRPDKPSHTPGVREGNALGGYAREAGHLPDGRATARRSTGINPEARNPIDARMPNLPPA
jgi:hypothetical protein